MTSDVRGQIIAKVPTLESERSFWQAGLLSVAGVDEVGRGALAGPLVAAAVVFPACQGARLSALRRTLTGVRDSKTLTSERRTMLLSLICQVADAVAIGVVEADELDIVGIAAANRLATERAVLRLPSPPDALLLDAFLLDVGVPQVAVIDGDARCLSIAAASIVAKVTRDRFMVHGDDLFPRYGFAAHKGYGTFEHQESLKRHGPCPLHRHSFAPVRTLLGLDG